MISQKKVDKLEEYIDYLIDLSKLEPGVTPLIDSTRLKRSSTPDDIEMSEKLTTSRSEIKQQSEVRSKRASVSKVNYCEDVSVQNQWVAFKEIAKQRDIAKKGGKPANFLFRQKVPVKSSKPQPPQLPQSSPPLLSPEVAVNQLRPKSINQLSHQLKICSVIDFKEQCMKVRIDKLEDDFFWRMISGDRCFVTNGNVLTLMSNDEVSNVFSNRVYKVNFNRN